MHSFSNFSLSRWIGLCRKDSCFDHAGDNDEDNNFKCYACTQGGVVPVFHSTSCDQVHPPEWEASAGSSLVPIHNGKKNHRVTGSSYARKSSWMFGTVLDPRRKRIQKWNRAFLLARAFSLVIDPLFFYALSIGTGVSPCLYMDGGLAASVTALRTCVDAVHLFHLWIQFRLAYVSRESLVVGCGNLVWDARAIASHYIRSLKGFWLDAFVILPIPQVVYWLVVPKLLREGNIKLLMTILIIIFLFQFLPKVYHSIFLTTSMQKVTGYLFGNIWWGVALNLIAYLIAAHVTGGFWYLLSIQRVMLCLEQRCARNVHCPPLSCSNEVCYQGLLFPNDDALGIACGGNSTIPEKLPVCFEADGPFNYGIYDKSLSVVSSNSLGVKLSYPIFWGLTSLSTFGNTLEPASQWLEVIYSIILVLLGLMLFTLSIGNIQVFLHTAMANKTNLQLRRQDIEWWMKRRQLPSRLRRRVCRFERQKWEMLGGEDEMEMIKDLPEGLRRDIKRYLCLDLMKKVPLFHSLNDLILDNICDRVKPLVYSKDEKIIREGDPVQKMVFIVRGRIKTSQKLSKGRVATSIIEPGGYFGDELLSWSLRRPFINRLPASSATFVCIESMEAFSLDAIHLKYITDHFRYNFANEKLRRTARYYSSNWRTWAAVNIQLAWRRYRTRTRGLMISAADNGNSSGHPLLRYASSVFLSFRPHDHLE